MNNFKPGYIIKLSNEEHPEITGVVVNCNKDNVICFNTDNNQKPVFYQVNLQDPASKLELNNKTINNPEYNSLKQALLKYYNNNKHNETDIKILESLMSFSFPNGIPVLKDMPLHQHIEENNTDVDENNPKSKYSLGTQIKVKCIPRSSVSFLNDQVLDIYDHFPGGLRVVKRGATSDTNKLYNLFYRADSSLAGIKEVIILQKRIL